MEAAVIAAGQGERLRRSGWLLPKPLVPIAGRPLLEYVLRGLCHAGATRVAAVLNTRGSAVELYCRRHWPALEFAFVYRDTPNSMESLFALEPVLQEKEFLLATADTLIAPHRVKEFCITALGDPVPEVALAVTTFVEDEKPLWVAFESDGRVVALGATAQGSGWVTAGLYFLRRSVFHFAEAARTAELGALREFLGLLLQSRVPIRAIPVGKCIDVDRPEDLPIAAQFVDREYPAYA